jgi:hypothetical protein
MTSKECNGQCDLPPVDTFEEPQLSIRRSDLLVFFRNKSIRLGQITSIGPKNLKVSVCDMKSNTKIPANTDLVPMTVYVERKILDSLETE